jgi:hypothetical protein
MKAAPRAREREMEVAVSRHEAQRARERTTLQSIITRLRARASQLALSAVNSLAVAIAGPSPEWSGRPAPKVTPIYVMTFADGSQVLTRVHPTEVAEYMRKLRAAGPTEDRIVYDKPCPVENACPRCRAGMS